jgi:protein involved in temperature-dependent protein secretion
MTLSGRTAEAIGEYRRALKQRPGQAAWHYELALLLEHSGSLTEAQQQAQVAASLEPQNTQYQRLLARLLTARS